MSKIRIKSLKDRIISQRREVLVHKTSWISPLFFIEVPAPSWKGERECTCMLRVSLLSLSMIFVLDFGNVSTVL